MFAKAIILAGLSALAAAQSPVLTFTDVPQTVTDGQQQSKKRLTWLHRCKALTSKL